MTPTPISSDYVPDASYGALANDSSPLGEVNTTTTPSASPSNVPDSAVLIGIRVPENAQIWIDGQKTSQTGAFREFVTPSLEPGQKFAYHIKAVWTEKGQEVVRNRQISFYGGDRLMVNMLAPDKKDRPAASAKP
jgi:uncharacterized protein (TIGR03000 family)